MVFRFVLEEGKTNPNITNTKGRPILLEIAGRGNIEMIKLYLSRGGKLNVKDRDSKWNALHFAVNSNQLETTKFLVAVGINFKKKSHIGKSPLELAKEGNKANIVNFLQEVEQE